MSRKQTDLPESYAVLLGELKERIAASQFKVALAVNSELILLYGEIGRELGIESRAGTATRQPWTDTESRGERKWQALRRTKKPSDCRDSSNNKPSTY